MEATAQIGSPVWAAPKWSEFPALPPATHRDTGILPVPPKAEHRHLACAQGFLISDFRMPFDILELPPATQGSEQHHHLTQMVGVVVRNQQGLSE